MSPVNQLRSLVVVLGLTLACAAPAAPPVGDPGSFGNNVIYLGLADSQTVRLLAKCPAVPPTNGDRCVTLNPQPASTSFDEADVASIELPPEATDTLLCFSFTPFLSNMFGNSTAVARQGQLKVVLSVTVSSSVLQDPSLLDPATGLPLNGSLPHGMVIEQQSFTMQPQDFRLDNSSRSRDCAYGFVHRAQLVDYYGLTPAQADDFFAGPITLTFGVYGTATLLETGIYDFVVRLYGDDK
jgi:hypothetical protein